MNNKILKEYYGNMCLGPFGNPMPEEDARLLDKELETTEDDIFVFKYSSSGFEYFIDGEKADVSIITDSSVDEEGESIDVKSIDWNSFRKNPVVNFNHNFAELPLGKSQWQKLIGDKWKAKTIFAPRPENYPVNKEWFPDNVYSLIKDGFLPGKSIGGIAKRRIPTEEDIKLNPNLSKAKIIRFNSKVYEYSVVTRQCNNNAVVEAVSKGLIKMSQQQLEHVFPELKEIQKDIIKIDKYLTVDQYEKQLLTEVMTGVAGINQRTPELIDNALARMFGKP